MDRANSNSESFSCGSFGRTSSGGSSVRRRGFSGAGQFQIDEDIELESESVSEAGDIGDRALHSNRYSDKGSFRLSLDNAAEQGMVAEDALVRSYRSASRSYSNVSPLPEGHATPLSTDAMISPQGTKEDERVGLPKSMEYIASLIHLAVFGILGVLTRYLLQKLFGPGFADFTNDRSALYLDLPANVVGSFLMGWLGVVFKGDISNVSEYLAIGLSTGYLGSLTTFSGWNQKMLDLSVDGEWVTSFLGFLLGLSLAAYSIIFGVETAKGFRFLLTRVKSSQRDGPSTSFSHWRVNSYKRHMSVIMVLALILCLLSAMSGILVKKNFNYSGSGAQLWLACLVAPPGVWIRWFLARLNGHGLGKAGRWKWVPFGTLIANVSAACIMAALATTKKAVDTSTCNTVINGIQLGLLGCLSTVSTFMAEFHAMRESIHPWRAYAYATLTIILSFGLGVLLYSVPVWTKGYS